MASFVFKFGLSIAILGSCFHGSSTFSKVSSGFSFFVEKFCAFPNFLHLKDNDFILVKMVTLKLDYK